jgi:hypothetical protein
MGKAVKICEHGEKKQYLSKPEAPSPETRRIDLAECDYGGMKGHSLTGNDHHRQTDGKRTRMGKTRKRAKSPAKVLAEDASFGGHLVHIWDGMDAW